jgi:SOS response regulatory protein OraA/RecX
LNEETSNKVEDISFIRLSYFDKLVDELCKLEKKPEKKHNIEEIIDWAKTLHFKWNLRFAAEYCTIGNERAKAMYHDSGPLKQMELSGEDEDGEPTWAVKRVGMCLADIEGNLDFSVGE